AAGSGGGGMSKPTMLISEARERFVGDISCALVKLELRGDRARNILAQLAAKAWSLGTMDAAPSAPVRKSYTVLDVAGADLEEALNRLRGSCSFVKDPILYISEDGPRF